VTLRAAHCGRAKVADDNFMLACYDATKALISYGFVHF
jgi:hypothetical protein